MAEINPVLTPTAPATTASAVPPADAQPYRPLSLLALAGLLLAAIYVLIVVVGAVVALVKGTPVFLAGWTLAVAVAAAAVSLLAQWHIRNSEGTRAGLALAHWGLGLSLFVGIGYSVYQYFTGLALTRQANEFLMVEGPDSGFFPRLQSGDPVQLNYAFLLTKPESSRGNIDPADEQKMIMIHDRQASDSKGKGRMGALSTFRSRFLVRSIFKYGKYTQIEPLGVQSWTYEKHSYKVMRNYRIATPEMVFNVVLPVLSTEGAQGERKWFLGFPGIEYKSGEYTPLGEKLMKASFVARLAVARLANGKALGEFPDETNWEKAVPGEAWQPIRDRIRKYFLEGGEHQIQLQAPAAEGRDLPPWQVEKGRLRFTFDAQYTVRLFKDEGRMASAQVVVESTKPIQLDANGLPVPDSIPTTVELPGEKPAWRIAAIRLGRLADMSMMRPPQ